MELRVRAILKNQLNIRNKTKVINTLAMPIITYSFKADLIRVYLPKKRWWLGVNTTDIENCDYGTLCLQ